jgi:competence protein CoiA
MLCSINNNGVKIIASDSTKAESPFVCPLCKSEVILHKGRIKIAHFSHLPKSLCSYGRGETTLHRTCKTSLYHNLSKHPDIRNCELEKILPPRDEADSVSIPDIYFDKIENGRTIGIAIEVQVSSLSEQELFRRTTAYKKKGIYVLWLHPIDKKIERVIKLDRNKYSPRFWEKWVYALYFGNVYYFYGGLDVLPLSFEDHYIEVPLTDFGGGYSKRSKRYRDVNVLSPMNIISDFISFSRNQWKHMPAALLYGHDKKAESKYKMKDTTFSIIL